MSDHSYQIVFRGRLTPGASQTEVAANLARLFKTDSARIEALFDGGRKVLKQGLDKEAADRYRAVLRQAGALVSVVNAENRSAAVSRPKAAPPPAPPPPSTAARAVFQVDDPASPATPEAQVDTPAADEQPVAVGDDALLSPPGVQLTQPLEVAAPVIDLAHLDLADVGAIFDESARPPPLEVEFGSLSASDDFDRLDEQPRPTAPQIDIFDLDLAEPDAIVDESAPPPPLQVDVTGLSASDDYQQLDDQPRSSEPDIDISGLELER